jgi:hypothetical protein
MHSLSSTASIAHCLMRIARGTERDLFSLLACSVSETAGCTRQIVTAWPSSSPCYSMGPLNAVSHLTGAVRWLLTPTRCDSVECNGTVDTGLQAAPALVWQLIWQHLNRESRASLRATCKVRWTCAVGLRGSRPGEIRFDWPHMGRKLLWSETARNLRCGKLQRCCLASLLNAVWSFGCHRQKAGTPPVVCWLVPGEPAIACSWRTGPWKCCRAGSYQSPCG